VGLGASILDSAVAGCLMLTGEGVGAADITFEDESDGLCDLCLGSVVYDKCCTGKEKVSVMAL